MMEPNYFALQVSSKLDIGRNADVYSPLFARGAVATSLLIHAAQTAYFMDDKKKASEYYENAVAKIMKDFCVAGEPATQAEINGMFRISREDRLLILEHYDHQAELDKSKESVLNPSFKFRTVEFKMSETVTQHTVMLIPTEEAGVDFSSINLLTGNILYEQPNEAGYEYWSDGFITKQDNEIFRSLIASLEQTSN